MPDKAEGEKSKRPEISRLKKLEQEHKEKNGDEPFEPDMPPIFGMEYMIDLLWQVGPTVPAGGGSASVTHAELAKFQSNTGIELNEWECTTLRRLSLDFMSESFSATKRDCPPPWMPHGFVIDLSSVARSLEEQMEKLIAL